MTDNATTPATPPSDGSKKHPQPDAKEAMFFYAIMKNNRATTDVDWDAVALEAGFKNAAVAKACLSSEPHSSPISDTTQTRFRQIKLKLGLEEPSASKPSSSKPGVMRAPKPATGRKRKAADADGDEDEDGSPYQKKPVKRAHRKKAEPKVEPKVKLKQEPEDDDDGDDELATVEHADGLNANADIKPSFDNGYDV